MLNGDSTQVVQTQLTSLVGQDAAVPNLWDTRFQILINNDANINARVQAFENGTRAPRSVQLLADLPALRAFLTPTPGEVVYIPGTGLYKFYSAAAEAENLPWTVRPDSNTGRWRIDMVPRSQLAVANGVATLDGNSFLTQSVGPGSITTDKLAAGAVSGDKLGNVTVDQSIMLTVDTATFAQVFGALAGQLKAVTGGGTWRAVPNVSLAALNQYGARLDRAQTWAQPQTMTNLTVTGLLIIPVV
jgi:hypothetical protein